MTLFGTEIPDTLGRGAYGDNQEFLLGTGRGQLGRETPIREGREGWFEPVDRKNHREEMFKWKVPHPGTKKKRDRMAQPAQARGGPYNRVEG